MVMIVKSSKETWGHSWSSPSYECWTLNNVICISRSRTSYSCCVGCPLKMPLIRWNITLHYLDLKSSYHSRWSYGDMVTLWKCCCKCWNSSMGTIKVVMNNVTKIYIKHTEWREQGVWILTHMGKWLILDGHVDCEDIFKMYVWVFIQLSFHRH